MLTLPIYLRGSSYYLHTRFLGKQFKKSLKTADKQTAIILASKILEAAKMSIDLSKLNKYHLDIANGIAQADSPEDHIRMLETMQLMATLKAASKPTETATEPPKQVQAYQSTNQQETVQGLTYLEALDKMLLLKPYRAATVLAYKDSIEEFSIFIGNTRKITSLMKSDIGRFQEHLLIKQKNSHRTVDKKVGVIKSLMNFAIKHGHYNGENPAANKDLLTKRDKAKGGYEIFEDSEIKAIFKSQFLDSAQKEDKDYYWTLVLALFSGCRISEITSLTAEQFKITESGVKYFKIVDAKTNAGIREIPIPQFLFEDGLKGFIPKTGQLFKYKMTLGKGSGNAVGKKFKRHLEELKIERPKLVFHSIRKYTNNFFKSQNIDIEPRCQFFGHELDNVNSSIYSNNYTVDQLATIFGPAQEELAKKVYRIYKL